MASPWKFLTRLVSPKRQQKLEQRAIKDVTPKVLAIAGPAETMVEDSFHPADRPADEQPHPVDRANAVPREPEQPQKSRRGVHDERLVANDSVKLGPDSEPTLPDVGPPAETTAAKVEETAGFASPKRRTRPKKAEPVVIVSEISSAAPSVSDEWTSLDIEINILRSQLAVKLRLQNGQLRKMLARFER